MLWSASKNTNWFQKFPTIVPVLQPKRKRRGGQCNFLWLLGSNFCWLKVGTIYCSPVSTTAPIIFCAPAIIISNISKMAVFCLIISISRAASPFWTTWCLKSDLIPFYFEAVYYNIEEPRSKTTRVHFRCIAKCQFIS